MSIVNRDHGFLAATGDIDPTTEMDAMQFETRVISPCINCGSREVQSASYDVPAAGFTLPATRCAGCGCLELDDQRAGVIASRLGAQHVATLRGTQLRKEVRRVLSASFGRERRSMRPLALAGGGRSFLVELGRDHRGVDETSHHAS
jgi:hypothetical protein